MSDPAFTILLPVNRPPALLPYAIASVLAQERQDFELFVICDGAPRETAQAARHYATGDPRIRVFEHPKGERHGEAYRDQALSQARGTFVGQLGDDDLWLPNHLSEMARLLDQCDFGNLPQVEVAPDGGLALLPGNLADPDTRLTMVSQRFNFFGPTVSGYRLAAYCTLPVGWTPAPIEVPTDLFMWRKFLARDDLRFGTRMVVSAIKFSANIRSRWSLDRRQAEIAAWAERLSTLSERERVAQAALLGLSQEAFNLRQRVARMNKAASEGAQRTAAMDKQLQQLRTELHDSTARLDEQSRKLQKMRRSWSWRLTRPVRKLARLIAPRH